MYVSLNLVMCFKGYKCPSLAYEVLFCLVSFNDLCLDLYVRMFVSSKTLLGKLYIFYSSLFALVECDKVKSKVD